MSLRILTLGRFRVLAQGAEVRGMGAQPVRSAVLAYLAASEGVTRDRLLGTFWPERTEARARHALSQILHKLRRDLGPDWLEADGEVLGLSGSVEVDARDFERAAQLFDHEAALRIYRGPFLDGWPTRSTHTFQLWMDAQRSRLATLHAAACRELARKREGAGDLEAAIAAIRCWTASDPLHETPHLELVQLLLHADRRSEAVTCHREFLGRLAAERVEPSAEFTSRLKGMLRPGVVVRPSGSEPRGKEQVENSRGTEGFLVVPFENLTGDPDLDSLGRHAADWITEGLHRAGIRKVLPILDELRLLEPVGGPPDPAHGLTGIREVGRSMGAGALVTGSYSRITGTLEFRAQIVDVEEGELLGVIEPVHASRKEEADGLSLLRERVLGLVAAMLDTDWTGLPTSPELGLPPPTYAAYRAYSFGLEHYVRQEWVRAIPLFREALALDPEFRRPGFLAAACHLNLGEWDSVADLMASLRAMRGGLSPYESSSLAWYEANLAGDRLAAYEVSARGGRLFPGTTAQFVAGLDAIRINRPGEAIRILLSLSPERGWLRHFYDYWDMLCSAHHMLGEHAVELVVARRGRQQSPTLSSLLAYEVRALAPGGMGRELEDCLAKATDLPPQPGWPPARLAILAAAEMRAHGHAAAGKRMAERAVRWLEEDTSHGLFGASSRGELARALCLAGRWTEAEEILRELAQQFPQNVDYRGRLAVLAARMGDRDAADRGDRTLQLLNRPYLFGRETVWRARVAALLGEEDRAVRLLVRAFAEGHSHGVELHADPDLEPLRKDEAFRRLLRPKG